MCRERWHLAASACLPGNGMKRALHNCKASGAWASAGAHWVVTEQRQLLKGALRSAQPLNLTN